MMIMSTQNSGYDDYDDDDDDDDDDDGDDDDDDDDDDVWEGPQTMLLFETSGLPLVQFEKTLKVLLFFLPILPSALNLCIGV